MGSSLEFRNIVDSQEVTVDGKKKKVQTLKPIATAVAEYKAGSLTPSTSGSGSSNTGGENTGGDNGGGSAGFETGGE